MTTIDTRSTILHCCPVIAMRGGSDDLYRHVAKEARGIVRQVLFSRIKSCRISEVLCPTTTIEGRLASLKTSKEWQSVDGQMPVVIR